MEKLMKKIIKKLIILSCIVISCLVIFILALYIFQRNTAHVDLNKTMTIFSQGSNSQKNSLITKIKAHPEKYAPPVFYALSDVLFKTDKKAAMFWFYAGQLRARYDANRCTDVSAGAAIGSLNYSFGLQINQYAFKNLDQLKSTIEEVIKFDKKTPHKYDQRWINFHGMAAFDKNNKMTSKPRSEWEAIEQKTRDDYFKDFQNAIKQLEKTQP